MRDDEQIPHTAAEPFRSPSAADCIGNGMEGNGREGKGEEQKTQKRIPEVPTSAAPRPPAAPFPASDDPRVQSMHGLAIGLGIRPNLLHVQQWVADGLTEDQLGAALAKAQSKKPGQTIPLNFLQCFIAEIRATHYDAEAVRNATIAGIAAREGHVAH